MNLRTTDPGYILSKGIVIRYSYETKMRSLRKKIGMSEPLKFQKNSRALILERNRQDAVLSSLKTARKELVFHV